MDTKDERLDSFQNHLLDNGYSKAAAKNYRFRVSTFLKAHPEALSASKDEARAIIDDYNAKLPRNTSRTIPAAAVKRWRVFEFGEPYQPRIHPSSCTGDEAIDEECMQFRTYLDEHADIGLATKRNRVNSIRLFLYATKAGCFSRESIALDDIVAYHTAQSANDGASMRAINSTDLRSYMKFLRSEGVDIGPLDSISLSGPTRREHIVPGRLSEDEYETLLASCGADTPRGLRDKAMALCMGNLALRACDVARLSLDDVDWANGSVTAHRSKSKAARTLPIDERTGKALEEYVLARCAADGVRALLANANGMPIASSQARTAMSLAAGRACIDSYRGTHGLRRMVATNMVNAGVDVKTIADVLGHERIDTTARYMKVSLPNLMKVAGHWPKEVGDD